MTEYLTLNQAKSIISALASKESVLLLSSPGLGKSEIVRQAAQEAGLECRSLLGTQIAPEDVSGVPRIENERTVFFPPRILLPHDDKPFCLFLDELPAANPDVQKAFYAVLLERRIGERPLPEGSWVVAAGNRAEDKALVRTISSALVNRVLILNVHADTKEWLAWASANAIRPEIISYISLMPDKLSRPVPEEPVPFSTPRAWASLSRALDMAEKNGALNDVTRRAITCGKISVEDAGLFCAISQQGYFDLRPPIDYVREPSLLPLDESHKLWFILMQIKKALIAGDLKDVNQNVINQFLSDLPLEAKHAVLIGAVDAWGDHGADNALLSTLRELTGLNQ